MQEHVPLSLVVVERGREAPRRTNDADETLIIAQGRDEPSVELARRVMRTLAVVEASGRRLADASILVSSDCDDRAMTARHFIARALVHHARVVGDRFEIVLAVHGSATPDLRHAVMALVDFLLVAPGRSKVPVRVSFEPERDLMKPGRSGVRLRALQPPARGIVGVRGAPERFGRVGRRG